MADGKVTSKMIENIMPPDEPDSLIIVCGPPALKSEVKEILEEMEYKNYYIFN